MTQDQQHTSLTDDAVEVRSTWPWRGSEVRMVVALALLGLAVAVWGGGWWWTAAPVGAASAYQLYRVGRYRKAHSLVVATVSRQRLVVRARNTLGDSAVDLGAVEEIGFRAFQSDRTLLVRGGGSAARVPERLLDQEPVREALRVVLARGPKVAPEARAVLAAAGLL